MNQSTRRNFLAASALSAGRVMGANDRIRIGCIGVGMNGSGMLKILMQQSEEPGAHIEVAGISDIYEKRKSWAKETAKLSGRQVHHDYRELIARPDLDAIFISVPDHWHKPMTMDALAAGKDVYLQKPMTLTIDEAREISSAVARLGRVVQVGSQHLSDKRYHVARDLIAAGEIGTLLWAQSTYSRNSLEGEWNYFIDPEASADTIDWKRWLGSAPNRAFSAERFFRWRKYWDYSGGIATDLFYHRLGPLLFSMGAQFPSQVSSTGGIYVQRDREVPDTYSTVVEYQNFYVSLSGSMANAGAQKYLPQVIYGNKGSLVIEDRQVRIVPERTYSQDNVGTVHPVEQGELNRAHTADFFSCMRSRKSPVLDAKLGYQIMTAIRLGIDSYRQKRTMFFDPAAQRVVEQSPARPAYEGDGTNHPKAKRIL
ncbi:MAG: Gfo/Idh/MocA family oxidoreductase [Bryobacterales bacterium]|nr:Gfo/Idh/MocA family oxidoreductase [Bryobacterales bacterium]